MKYKSNVIVTVEYDPGTEDPRAFLARQMDALLPKGFDFSIANVSKVKRANKILGRFPPEQVLPFITGSPERKEYVVDGQSYMVRMDSHRYHVFANNSVCVACGLVGTVFLLELPADSPQPHFNFYGEENGHLILLTKDHIRSRAHGGEDRPENYQTMCATCNCLKGSSRLSIEAVRELRTMYNELRRGASKTQLTAKIRKAKQALIQPAEPGERASYTQKMRAIHLAESKSSKKMLVARTDLVLTAARGQLIAISQHESRWREMLETSSPEIIAQIPAGTKLDVTGNHRQRKVGILHNGKEVYVYHGLLEYADVWDVYNKVPAQAVPAVPVLDHILLAPTAAEMVRVGDEAAKKIQT